MTTTDMLRGFACRCGKEFDRFQGRQFEWHKSHCAAHQPRGPFNCVDCDGTGEVPVPCVVHHACHCGPCMVRCETCDGAGVRLCDACGEFAAMERVNNDLLCTACSAEERRVSA